MGLTVTNIRAKVENLMDVHGKSIEIEKFVSAASDRYRQGDATYASTFVQGRVIMNPTPEQLSFIGNAEEIEVAFMFSRDHLEAAFGALPENEWITTKDRIKIEGKTFNVLQVRPTGRAYSDTTMVAVLGKEPK